MIKTSNNPTVSKHKKKVNKPDQKEIKTNISKQIDLATSPDSQPELELIDENINNENIKALMKINHDVAAKYQTICRYPVLTKKEKQQILTSIMLGDDAKTGDVLKAVELSARISGDIQAGNGGTVNVQINNPLFDRLNRSIHRVSGA